MTIWAITIKTPNVYSVDVWVFAIEESWFVLFLPSILTPPFVNVEYFDIVFVVLFFVVVDLFDYINYIDYLFSVTKDLYFEDFYYKVF